MCQNAHYTVVSKFGDYRNSDGISSEGKSSDYFKKKISVSANSVSIFWALKYIESKLSDQVYYGSDCKLSDWFL